VAHKHGGPEVSTPGPPSTIDALTVQHRADMVRVLAAVRSDEYAAGFAAGWADRGEYERRRQLLDDGMTFDDALALGYELGRTEQPRRDEDGE